MKCNLKLIQGSVRSPEFSFCTAGNYISRQFHNFSFIAVELCTNKLSGNGWTYKTKDSNGTLSLPEEG